jgi:tRNA threonylcarbamoyl adenosine modification protein YeaZ
MKILALEFSSPQRSVAVLSCPEGGFAAAGSGNEDVGGKRSVACLKDGALTEQCPPRTELRLPGSVVEMVETGRGATGALTMIEEVLRDAGVEREQIERLAIGLGPGSYTGIRASLALAQGWQLAHPVKLQGISSAECLALQARAEGLTGLVNIVMDAQRGEFYLARYELSPEGYSEVDPLRLATLAELSARQQAGEALLGPDITRWFPAGRMLFPSAATLAKMAAGRKDFVPGEKLEPIYLRKTEFVKAPPPRRLP